MSKFVMTLAYDVPHYRDFVVDAASEAEALERAEAALRHGHLADIDGDAHYEDSGNDRVFGHECPSGYIDHLPTLDSLIGPTASRSSDRLDGDQAEFSHVTTIGADYERLTVSAIKQPTK